MVLEQSSRAYSNVRFVCKGFFYFFQGKSHINNVLSIDSIQQDLFIILQSVSDLTGKSYVPRNVYYLGRRDILQGSSLEPSSMSSIYML